MQTFCTHYLQACLDHLEQHKILTDLQHGFRSGRSCETQFITTFQDIAEMYDKKGSQIDIAVLDFSKAFDTVPHDGLLSKLKHYGIDKNIWQWISNFFKKREQCVVVDGVSSGLVDVDSGVPQGTVLGPILFLLHINDVPSIVSSKVRLFADDCLIYRQIKSNNDQIELQRDLNLLESWGAKWGMRFNAAKCNIMRVSRMRLPFLYSYKLSGQVLDEVKDSKYLGVTISDNLDWSKHITTTTTTKANVEHITILVRASRALSMLWHLISGHIMEETCPHSISHAIRIANIVDNCSSVIVVTLQLLSKLTATHSCGHDNISSTVLKYISNEISECITLIVNQSIMTGIYPDSLKVAKVVPIFKKEDKLQLKNYRPISVLPVISKIFENVMLTQLVEYFTTNNLLSSQQYGFRSNRSTDLAALELMDRNIKNMNDNLWPVNIYLDFSKAFDSLNHIILLSRLKFYGIQQDALCLLKSYLTNRSQYVQLNNVKSSHHTVLCGIPQGSVLGPLMFNIFINDIIKASSKFDFILYADDTTLVSTLENFGTLNNVAELENAINCEISKISSWLVSNMLVLNVAKSKLMLFFKSPKCPPKLTLTINGDIIEQVEEFNLLASPLIKMSIGMLISLKYQ